MDIFSEIREMIITEFLVEEEEVVAEATIQDDLAADSLAIMNLAAAISKRYRIKVKGDDLADIEDVDELIKFVESKIVRT